MKSVAAKLTSVPKQPMRLKDNAAVWSEFIDLGVKHKCVSLG